MKKILGSLLLIVVSVLAYSVHSSADEVWDMIEVNDSKKEWNIGFNTTLDEETINDETVMIYKIENNNISELPTSIELKSDEKTVSVQPQREYEEDSVYFLLITTGVHSDSGERISENVRRKFTYEKEEVVVNPENVTYVGDGIEHMNYQEGDSSNSFSYEYDGDEVVDNVGNVFDDYLSLYVSTYAYGDEAWNFIEFPTLGNYDYFEANLALPQDYKMTTDTLDFNIYADNELVYNKKIKAGDFPDNIRVNIKNADKVKFRLNTSGNGSSEIMLLNPRFIAGEKSIDKEPLKRFEYPGIAYLGGNLSYMNYQEGDSSNSFNSGFQSTKVKDNIGREFDSYVTSYVSTYAYGEEAWNYVEYPLDGNYSTFTASLGITDEYKSTKDSIRYKIYGDGEELFTTRMVSGDLPQDVKINVENVDKLRFYMETDGESSTEIGLFNPVLK